jgi:hypothetical protein
MNVHTEVEGNEEKLFFPLDIPKNIDVQTTKERSENKNLPPKAEEIINTKKGKILKISLYHKKEYTIYPESNIIFKKEKIREILKEVGNHLLGTIKVKICDSDDKELSFTLLNPSYDAYEDTVQFITKYSCVVF